MTTTAAQSAILTADDLLRMPEGEKFYELVRGTLRVSEPAGGRHGMIAGNLFFLLSIHVREHALGSTFPDNTGYLLARNPDTVRSPDASFVRLERLSPDEVGPGFIELAPDLAVEVISPSDRVSNLAEKLADYRTAGVRAVWVVDPPSRTVTVHAPDGSARTLRDDEMLEGGAVVPGFRCAVAELFAGVRKDRD